MGWPLLFAALVLAAEPLVRYVLHFYQPKGLRAAPRPAGNSLILDAAFGRGRNLRDTLQSFAKMSPACGLAKCGYCVYPRNGPDRYSWNSVARMDFYLLNRGATGFSRGPGAARPV